MLFSFSLLIGYFTTAAAVQLYSAQVAACPALVSAVFAYLLIGSCFVVSVVQTMWPMRKTLVSWLLSTMLIILVVVIVFSTDSAVAVRGSGQEQKLETAFATSIFAVLICLVCAIYIIVVLVGISRDPDMLRKSFIDHRNVSLALAT